MTRPKASTPVIEGVKWWSLITVEGYSRTLLAGAVAPGLVL